MSMGDFRTLKKTTMNADQKVKLAKDIAQERWVHVFNNGNGAIQMTIFYGQHLHYALLSTLYYFYIFSFSHLFAIIIIIHVSIIPVSL